MQYILEISVYIGHGERSEMLYGPFDSKQSAETFFVKWGLLQSFGDVQSMGYGIYPLNPPDLTGKLESE